MSCAGPAVGGAGAPSLAQTYGPTKSSPLPSFSGSVAASLASTKPGFVLKLRSSGDIPTSTLLLFLAPSPHAGQHAG